MTLSSPSVLNPTDYKIRLPRFTDEVGILLVEPFVPQSPLIYGFTSCGFSYKWSTVVHQGNLHPSIITQESPLTRPTIVGSSSSKPHVVVLMLHHSAHTLIPISSQAGTVSFHIITGKDILR